jgi:hypothetical protein
MEENRQKSQHMSTNKQQATSQPSPNERERERHLYPRERQKQRGYGQAQRVGAYGKHESRTGQAKSHASQARGMGFLTIDGTAQGSRETALS